MFSYTQSLRGDKLEDGLLLAGYVLTLGRSAFWSRMRSPSPDCVSAHKGSHPHYPGPVKTAMCSLNMFLMGTMLCMSLSDNCLNRAVQPHRSDFFSQKERFEVTLCLGRHAMGVCG